MNRSLILDIVVLTTVALACWRGWARKSIRETFALLGVIAGIFLVLVLTGPLAAIIEAVSSAEPGLSHAIAAVSVVVIALLAGTIAGYRIAKGTVIPGSRFMDSAGGALFAFARVLAIAGLVLFSLDILWGPQSVGHRMIADSVSGRLLAGDDSPFGTFYGSLVRGSDDLRKVKKWAERDDQSTAGYQQSELEATDERLELLPAAEREMLDAINEERRARGLEPLAWCGSCAEVARAHSKDMYRGGYFSHVDLDGDDPFDRMKAARIRYGAAGENLALAPSVPEAHEGLMESPDHRENILRAEFQEVGIGIYEGPFGLMCTQVFRALP